MNTEKTARQYRNELKNFGRYHKPTRPVAVSIVYFIGIAGLLFMTLDGLFWFIFAVCWFVIFGVLGMCIYKPLGKKVERKES
jgi:hypothetical protein